MKHNILSFICGMVACLAFAVLIGIGVAQQHDYPKQIRDLQAQHRADSLRLDTLFPKAVAYDSSNLRMTRAKNHIKSLVDGKLSNQ